MTSAWRSTTLRKLFAAGERAPGPDSVAWIIEILSRFETTTLAKLNLNQCLDRLCQLKAGVALEKALEKSCFVFYPTESTRI